MMLCLLPGEARKGEWHGFIDIMMDFANDLTPK
jgi:hypothetical protein